ncbi:MAG: Guanylate kinase [Candidatus Ozemobacter sibiricus]|jgi:guanylate kinase|uniref:Guanylate kinase n=1 Tax=Candidatus Ozemobacter sibiricus TaxID=2268124 RepID=A0A367ZP64_9BACT|nr:MAG: Guanylate kinase [Candidatus Ozemobacter sibiricus]
MTQPDALPGMKPKPLLFVISGPSGSGKGTALDFIERTFAPVITRSPTYTTRARRNGERDGKDYHYVDQARFDELVASKEIFEFTRTYNDELYGSPRRLIMADDEHHLLVELDFNGFHRLRSISRRKVIGIFIMPPSIDELSKRILARQPETNLERRLHRVSEQIAHAWSYDYIILNQDREEFLRRVRCCVEAELFRQDGIGFLTEHWHTLDVTLARS